MVTTGKPLTSRRRLACFSALCLVSLLGIKFYTSPKMFSIAYDGDFHERFKVASNKTVIVKPIMERLIEHRNRTLKPFDSALKTNVSSKPYLLRLNNTRLRDLQDFHNMKTNRFSDYKTEGFTNNGKTHGDTIQGDVKDKNVELNEATLKKIKDDSNHSKTELERTIRLPPPENLMKAGPFDFLPNYKNPCWLSSTHLNNITDTEVLCLPYFFMVGAPKAGTTDMHRRLVQHPQISSKVQKESHWLTRKHYRTNLRNLIDYQRRFFTAVTKDIIRQVDSEGKHNLVFGDCSASTLWDNKYLMETKEFQNVTEPPYTNADILHHLNPNTKILVMLRNPVNRLYSDFLYFQHGTPQGFHNKSLEVINVMQRCFEKYSVRQCLYQTGETKARMGLEGKIRIGIGIYYVHLQEYFRVFPREQIMVIKLEDFSNNTELYMEKVFSFLDIAPIEQKQLQRLANPAQKANSRKKKDKLVGDMLPETRQIIQEFYRPFNDKLVQLLGESFNYNT